MKACKFGDKCVLFFMTKPVINDHTLRLCPILPTQDHNSTSIPPDPTDRLFKNFHMTAST